MGSWPYTSRKLTVLLPGTLYQILARRCQEDWTMAGVWQPGVQAA